ncbi:hypothetical protein NIES4103_03470 [Nostoc sp. NIES-4103]|nr:hypothetical protein NIES4103_03470 [Nostoc sp. NIES-4103]
MAKKRANIEAKSLLGVLLADGIGNTFRIKEYKNERFYVKINENQGTGFFEKQYLENELNIRIV